MSDRAEFPPEAAAALVVQALIEMGGLGPKRVRQICRDYLAGVTDGADPRFVAGFLDIAATGSQRKTQAFKDAVRCSPFHKSVPSLGISVPSGEHVEGTQA